MTQRAIMLTSTKPNQYGRWRWHCQNCHKTGMLGCSIDSLLQAHGSCVAVDATSFRKRSPKTPDPGAAATGQALVKGVTPRTCQENNAYSNMSADLAAMAKTFGCPKRMTGYDRASAEELVAGGGE